MAEPFPYDVFLSHSSKDKEIVRPLAERLRADGIKVWFDEWEIHPGDSVPAKIERGLEQSRVLVLCMSKNAFGSDWAQLESGTFRFRDPLNTDRRFIPLKLDDAQPPGSLEEVLHIDWRANHIPDSYLQLLLATRHLNPPVQTDSHTKRTQLTTKVHLNGQSGMIMCVSFSLDGKLALTGAFDNTVRLWDVASGSCLSIFDGHTSSVNCVTFLRDGLRAISGSSDNTLRVWNLENGECQRVMTGHTHAVLSVAVSADGLHAVSGSADNTVRIWELESGRSLRLLKGHTGIVFSVDLSEMGAYVLSGSADRSMRLWDLKTGHCMRVFEGHTGAVYRVSMGHDEAQAFSGSADGSIRVWRVASGQCQHVLVGHEGHVTSLATGRDNQIVISGSTDHTLRVWNLASSRCERTLTGHTGAIYSVAMSGDGLHVLSGSSDKTVRVWEVASGCCVRVLEGHTARVTSMATRADGTQALSSSLDNTVRLWDVMSKRCLRVLEGHTGHVNSVAISGPGTRAISGSADKSLRVWDVTSGFCTRVIEGHSGPVTDVAMSDDGHFAITISTDYTIRTWDLNNGTCLRVLEGVPGAVNCVALSRCGNYAALGASYNIASVLLARTGQCVCALIGHNQRINSICLSINGICAITGSDDHTVRVWDVATGHCTRVMDGHTGAVTVVAVSDDAKFAASGSRDNTVRLWEVATGHCLSIFNAHSGGVASLSLSPDGRLVSSLDAHGVLRVCKLLDEMVATSNASEQQYTNAKVLVVGDTCCGKTSLSHRIVHDIWQPSEHSTIGAWSTQLPLNGTIEGNGIDREIWLWDFGGQADQRLIHQLYMDRASAILLLFNADNEDVLPGLRDWQTALKRSIPQNIPQFLVAGRTDAGFKASRGKLQEFANEHGMPFHETSAKEGHGCDQLKRELIDAIRWDRIAERTSPRIFKLIRDELIRLRDEGQVLLTLKELREVLRGRLTEKPNQGSSTLTPGPPGPSPGGRGEPSKSGDANRLDDATLRTVIGLLDGPGVIKELDYGHYVLLVPEWINAYAQAVIRTLRSADDELGALPIRSIAEGKLVYQSTGRDGKQIDMKRLGSTEERVVLGEMERVLEERGLCLRQGDKLVFPSHCGRDRPAVVEHPSVFVGYSVKGYLDDIYATLVVKLADMEAFDLDQLWRDAADFVTLDGKGHMGVKLSRNSASDGTISVYFGPGVTEEQQVIFAQYIDSHLKKTCEVSQRLREYVCPKCHTAKGNAKVLMERLLERKKQADTVCDKCDHRFPLWDPLEQLFASYVVREQVEELEAADKIRLTTRRIGKLLVLEVGARITSANQKWFEIPQDEDEGIDIEVEFCDDNGNGLGKKLGLQLKSGNSHLRPARKSDGVEVFVIKEQRWVDYWLKQPHPVMLVIGTFPEEDDRFGESQKKRFENVRWMEITSELRRLSENGTKPVKQIDFRGERLDLESVMKWRKKVLSGEVT